MLFGGDESRVIEADSKFKIHHSHPSSRALKERGDPGKRLDCFTTLWFAMTIELFLFNNIVDDKKCPSLSFPRRWESRLSFYIDPLILNRGKTWTSSEHYIKPRGRQYGEYLTALGSGASVPGTQRLLNARSYDLEALAENLLVAQQPWFIK